uniref:EGF-like domain-containing protein n=1 Tax=Eutreptiella gymnastica TaxID=73025 RepID=A0A7S1NC07_9EUGL|mmetsp:Transcript_152482/g.266178  ORF Transcript_152482/g.266178 Transcript_152482/m.266178 type:complete len:855 (+) Transcript_152482:72-2636(+)
MWLLTWALWHLVLQVAVANPVMRICTDRLYAGSCDENCVETVLPTCCASDSGSVSFLCKPLTGEVRMQFFHNTQCEGASLWKRTLPSNECVFGLPVALHFAHCPVTNVDPCQYKKCQPHQVCRVHERPLRFNQLMDEPYCADTCDRNGPCTKGMCELVLPACSRLPCPPVARCVERARTMRPALGDCRLPMWRDFAASEAKVGNGTQAECLDQILQPSGPGGRLAVYDTSTQTCWSHEVQADERPDVSSCSSNASYATAMSAEIQERDFAVPFDTPVNLTMDGPRIRLNMTLHPSAVSANTTEPIVLNVSNSSLALVLTFEHMEVACGRFALVVAADDGDEQSLCKGSLGTLPDPMVFSAARHLRFSFANTNETAAPNRTEVAAASAIVLVEDTVQRLTVAEDRNCLPWATGQNALRPAGSAVQCERMCLAEPDTCVEAVYDRRLQRCFLKDHHKGDCEASDHVMTFHTQEHCTRDTESFLYGERDLKLHMSSVKARGFEITPDAETYLTELCVHTGSEYRTPSTMDVYGYTTNGTGGGLQLLASTGSVRGTGDMDTCFRYDTNHNLVRMLAGRRYLVLYHSNGREFSMRVKHIDRQQGLPERFSHHIALEVASLRNLSDANMTKEDRYIPVHQVEFCKVIAGHLAECEPGKWGPFCQSTCAGWASDGVACSGHGTCRDGRDGDGLCTCEPGWFGVNCSLETVGGSAVPCRGRGASSDGTHGDGSCNCYDNDYLGHWTDYDCSACEAGWQGYNCKAPVCGDGIVNGYEECDDGNTAIGDCCNKNCAIEAGCHCNRTSVAGPAYSKCASTVNTCDSKITDFVQELLGSYSTVPQLSFGGLDSSFVEGVDDDTLWT